MKTLIAYTTDNGSTKKILEKMKDNLGDNVFLVNLKEQPNPDLKRFHRVIIGGSIHSGKIQKPVKEFCIRNLNALMDKELGLFICCMEEGDAAQQQLRDAYPEELRAAAKSTAIFRGSFDFGRMNFFKRLVVKRIARFKNPTSKDDFEAVHHFSRRMDRVFNPFLFLV